MSRKGIEFQLEQTREAVRRIEFQLEQAREAVRRFEDKLRTNKANRMFRCEACKKLHKISSCDVFEPLHYNNGAYEEGWESDNELWAVCPTTGIGNRFLFDDYNTPRNQRVGTKFFWEYRDLFKSLTTLMRNSQRAPEHQIRFINNYYIDSHRERFGLQTN
jgi:hypothetical protein